MTCVGSNKPIRATMRRSALVSSKDVPLAAKLSAPPVKIASRRVPEKKLATILIRWFLEAEVDRASSWAGCAVVVVVVVEAEVEIEIEA
jgi:hypothetical protein